MKKNIIYTLLFVVMASPAMAQSTDVILENKNSSKAWEIGIGGSVLQFNRTSFRNFVKVSDGYRFDLDMGHSLWGGNIYAARELNRHFYLDLQGTAGFTSKALEGTDKNKWMFMMGAGLQWRLGEYFGSKYIDPYLRVGVNYMYKDFKIIYEGNEGAVPDDITWILQNYKNKEGLDKKHVIPIAGGIGVNMWLNDRIGIGLQGDYLLMPYKKIANSLQGTARVMWRFGGSSKKPQPKIEYVEVERIIERIVEKKVEVPVKVESVQKPQSFDNLFGLFSEISFEFDKSQLLPESNQVLDEIATILKQNLSHKYLITGFTDSKGRANYNLELSRKRAKAVVDALIERGLPKSMLKSRGAGSSLSYAKPNASDVVRMGDRKVTIEQISNNDYWDYIKE